MLDENINFSIKILNFFNSKYNYYIPCSVLSEPIEDELVDEDLEIKEVNNLLV